MSGARALGVALLVASGCYHYRFEQHPSPGPTVEHRVRAATWVNGFVGTGAVDTRRYCEDPVRTELRVTATDVLLSIVTLLVYTPHTLIVVCPAAP